MTFDVGGGDGVVSFVYFSKKYFSSGDNKKKKSRTWSTILFSLKEKI